MMRKKKAAVAFLALLMFAGYSPARADGTDPFSTIQDLIQVANVTATGVSPLNVIVAWDNVGQCLPGGFTLPCVTIVNTFEIQISLDEAGPFTAIPKGVGGLYVNSCLRCVTSVKVAGLLGLSTADPRHFWIRVVPIVAISPNSIQGVPWNDGPIEIIRGRPSKPDPAMLGPFAPTDVLCNGGGDVACIDVNNVTISWTDNSDEQAFWIMRAKGATNPQFGTSPHATLGANVTTYSETLDALNTIFQYRVVAVRERFIDRLDGTRGPTPDIPERSFTNCLGGDNKDCAELVQSAPLAPPTSPSGLVATFTPPSTATLTWTDKEFNPLKSYIDEDGWFIEFTPDFTAVSTTDPTLRADWNSRRAAMLTRPASLGQGVVTWIDTHIPADTSLCYRVRGYRANTAGPAYSQYSPRPGDPDVCLGSIPKAPTNLVATAISNAQVDLTWTDNSQAELSDAIERCDGICTDSSTGWIQVGTAPRNATSFSDHSTQGLHTYSYRVFAVNASGRSASSNIAIVVTPVAPVGTPQNLQTTGMQHAIRLDWLDVTGETGYSIEFHNVGSPWSFLTSVGANVNTYVDSNMLGVNQTRCYRVRALDGPSKQSDASNESCATTLPPMPPAAPSNVKVVSTGGIKNTSIELTWNDNSNNEDSFVIEYIVFANRECDPLPDIADSMFREWGKVPATTHTSDTMNFTVTGLIPHSAYFFRVKARNKDGDSSYANAVVPASPSYPHTTGPCARTYGPLKPVWSDPSDNGDLKATRCDVTLTASDLGTDPDRVGSVLLYVNAYVPNSSLSNTDTVYAGPVPGPHDGVNHTEQAFQIQSASGTREAQVIIKYHFRRGFIYRLLATTYTGDAAQWASATAIVSDIQVYADCPIDSPPAPQPGPTP